MCEQNAKNQLLEVLKNLGGTEELVTFKHTSSSLHYSTVRVAFPDGREIQAIGKGQRSKSLILQRHKQYLISYMRTTQISWWIGEIYAEAQAGDALIKLSAYLSDLGSVGEKSRLLQALESDLHLAEIFDLWKSQGDPDLAIWGSKLSEKRKATLIEALIWRRFGKLVITGDATVQLQYLLEVLQ